MPDRILLLMAFAFALSSQGQRPFEGRIQYNVEYLSFPDGMEGIELALPQQMTLYVMGEQYRMHQRSALGGDLVMIRSGARDTVYQMFEFMDQKVFLALPQPDLAKNYRAVQKTDQRELAGTLCTKVYLQSADGDHREAWVDMKHSNPLSDHFPSLKQLPMAFDLERNGIWMRFTAQRVHSEPLDDTYFILPPNAVRIRPVDLQKISN